MRSPRRNWSAPGSIVVLGALVFGCSPPVEPKGAGDRQGAPSERRGAPILRPIVVPRDEAELCGDAYDDNHNGLINEGCNEPQGELHVVIAWRGKSEVDLDVFDPNGAVAPLGGATALGLVRTRDCPSDRACAHYNQESVLVEGDELAPGKYRIVIRALQIETEELVVALGARLASTLRSYEVRFTRADSAVELFLDVAPPPSSRASEAPPR